MGLNLCCWFYSICYFSIEFLQSMMRDRRKPMVESVESRACLKPAVDAILPRSQRGFSLSAWESSSTRFYAQTVVRRNKGLLILLVLDSKLLPPSSIYFITKNNKSNSKGRWLVKVGSMGRISFLIESDRPDMDFAKAYAISVRLMRIKFAACRTMWFNPKTQSTATPQGHLLIASQF